MFHSFFPLQILILLLVLFEITERKLTVKTPTSEEIAATRMVSHAIFDFAYSKKEGNLRMGRTQLLGLLKNPTCWNIFISEDGLRARLVHAELNIIMTGLTKNFARSTDRELIKAEWHNYVTNILGIKA